MSLIARYLGTSVNFHYIKINPRCLMTPRFPYGTLNPKLEQHPRSLSFLPTFKIEQHNQILLQKRDYAKGKDKKGKDKKQTKINLDEEEMAQVIDVEEMEEEFKSAIKNLNENFAKNLSLRTSLGSIESIPVKFEGDTYPLSEVAQVIRKSSSSIIINSSAFPQAIVDIKSAIEDSGMNLNPQQEGTTLYVTVPKVTKEYREGLAKNAKSLSEKCKVIIRNVQNKHTKIAAKKKGEISEDLVFLTQSKIREIAANYTKDVEDLLKAKSKELLQTKE